MLERTLIREMSQPDVREWLELHYNIVSEAFVKYVYDGYTHEMNYKPIRKSKTRKAVQLQFHKENCSKQLAQRCVKELIDII
ncbi:MAG: hypothetical protein KAH01_04865 [Caldisericia bacterium]|nr:hypothetical protein [Caldisericia bacterium]